MTFVFDDFPIYSSAPHPALPNVLPRTSIRVSHLACLRPSDRAYPRGPFISTSHTPYLTSVDVARISSRKPTGHEAGSRYLHACTFRHSTGSVAIARSLAASCAMDVNLRKSTMACGSGSVSYTSSVPKYRGTEPRLNAIQTFSVAYPSHAPAFSTAK